MCELQRRASALPKPARLGRGSPEMRRVRSDGARACEGGRPAEVDRLITAEKSMRKKHIAY